jgi:hypothetical protein
LAAASIIYQVPDRNKFCNAIFGFFLHALLAAGIDFGLFWHLLDSRSNDFICNTTNYHELRDTLYISKAYIQAFKLKSKKKFMGIYIFCSILPDDYVAGFCMGIPSGIF